MSFRHIGVRRLVIAPLAYAVAMFLSPVLFAAADEWAAAWIGGAEPKPGERMSAPGDEDDPPLSLQDFFAFGELGPPAGSPGANELDSATQAAIDDALRRAQIPSAPPDGSDEAIASSSH